MATATMLLLGAVTAGAEVIPLNTQATGPFITQGALIDTNGDGKTAHLLTAEGNSPQFGRLLFQAVAEFSTAASPTTCPNGNAGFQQMLLTGAIVTRVENEDLIHTSLNSGNACFDAVTGIIFVTANASITGGTGEFIGAKGSVSINQVVRTLIGEPEESGGFGSAVATYTGRIITQE